MKHWEDCIHNCGVDLQTEAWQLSVQGRERCRTKGWIQFYFASLQLLSTCLLHQFPRSHVGCKCGSDDLPYVTMLYLFFTSSVDFGKTRRNFESNNRHNGRKRQVVWGIEVERIVAGWKEVERLKVESFEHIAAGFSFEWNQIKLNLNNDKNLKKIYIWSVFAALTSCLVAPWEIILGFRLPVKKHDLIGQKKKEVIFWNDEGNWRLEWKYVEG